MSIVLFLLVLGLLIFVHELGHFLAAKKSGVTVHEFALGFPPTLWKRKVGETTYVLNLLPFGGYVRLEEENGEEEVPSPEEIKNVPKPKKEEVKKEPKEGSFASKGPLVKTFILIAGVTMNLLLAWILLSICLMIGYPTADEDINPKYVLNESVTILQVLPDSPAAEAKLLAGDMILSISDETRTETIDSAEEIGQFIQSSENDSVTIEIERAGKIENIAVSTSTELEAELDEDLESESIGENTEGEDQKVENKKMIGISTSDVSIVRYPPHIALAQGAAWTYNMTGATIAGIYTLITDAFRGQADISELAGPVGIVNLVGEAYAVGFVYLLSFTAIISINLAVVNMIPIPALDGGRILFTWIEAIKGSPIKLRTQLIANGIGFVLLILLMLFITFHDISKFFN